MDEKKMFEEVQARVRTLIKPFDRLTKLKVAGGGFLDQTEKALSEIPDSGLLVQGAAECVRHGKDVIRQIREGRAQEFSKAVASFVTSQRESGTGVREAHNAWRVGPVEIQLRPERSELRVMFNRQQLHPAKGWAEVSPSQTPSSMLAIALSKLHVAELPEDILWAALWDAYWGIRMRRDREKKPSTDRVPLKEAEPEFWAACVRLLIQHHKAGLVQKLAPFPAWAFLYNLDRYRKLGSQIPEGKRLAFVTGSQAEQDRLGGYVLNGLDPTQLYKTFCFISTLTAEGGHGEV